MDTKITLVVVVVLAVIAIVVVQMVQINSKLSSTGLATGNSVASTGGTLDTSDWTANEKMNYEMHGTIPARAKQSGGSAQGTTAMVGGC